MVHGVVAVSAVSVGGFCLLSCHFRGSVRDFHRILGIVLGSLWDVQGSWRIRGILRQICHCFRIMKDFQGFFGGFWLSWAKFWDLFGMLKDLEGFERFFEDSWTNLRMF